MPAKQKLVLLGAGKMGGAMLDGWLGVESDERAIHVIDPMPSEHLKAHERAGRITLLSAPDENGYGSGDILVLAVKPQMMDAALTPLAGATQKGALAISVAAGLSIAYFEKSFGPGVGIIRSMPNLPASIGAGITVAVAGGGVSEDDKANATKLLSAVGKVAWTNKEVDIDAVTAVSGSGPAYIFHMIEALAEAGKKEGLSPDLALLLAKETVKGAGLLAADSDLSPSTLRQNVTSPGGTTAAALEVLMGEGRLQKLMEEAVKAATTRSRELGGRDR